MVRESLRGVDTVFLVWPILDTSRADAVLNELTGTDRRVVYLSSSAVDDDRVHQTDPIVQVHADMERLLNGSGLWPLVLRSDTLASNVRGWVAQLRAGDVVTGPDIAPTAVVDERDVADAAVTLLLGHDDNNRDNDPYVLTGPEVLSRADLVAHLGAALGRDLRFEAVSAVLAEQKMLADGRPVELVRALVAASMHRPESNRVTDTVQRLTGRPARTFAQWATDHAVEFR
jgi:uncharacterized protein YbjT (DUF2867 family)